MFSITAPVAMAYDLALKTGVSLLMLSPHKFMDWVLGNEGLRELLAWGGAELMGLRAPHPETVKRMWELYKKEDLSQLHRLSSIELYPYAKNESFHLAGGIDGQEAVLSLAYQPCLDAYEILSDNYTMGSHRRVPSSRGMISQVILRNNEPRSLFVLVHELVHALDCTAGVKFYKDRDYYDQPHERRAYSMEMAWACIGFGQKVRMDVFRGQGVSAEMLVCAMAMLWPYRKEIRSIR